ncbi:hypothetical protein NDU88_006776 [Pleurodeles waltl]|uniref:Uncharacterized protein n=1 Tax=Pleurodeles waltl TaxID=8319 RepID=A0AAV7N9M2_PLEWA|nr:hypothetical protein NDU88_006776 [Pleurodeles waltl]
MAGTLQREGPAPRPACIGQPCGESTVGDQMTPGPRAEIIGGGGAWSSGPSSKMVDAPDSFGLEWSPAKGRQDCCGPDTAVGRAP